jgi:hypothetical protein
MPKRKKSTKKAKKKDKEINILTVSLNAKQTAGIFGIDYLGSPGLPARVVDKNRKITR